MQTGTRHAAVVAADNGAMGHHGTPSGGNELGEFLRFLLQWSATHTVQGGRR